MALFCDLVPGLIAHFDAQGSSLHDQHSFPYSLDGTDETLSVNLTSSLGGGGPARVSVCVFSSLCQYYNVEERCWSSRGLQPLEDSTLHSAHCLTRHLTMFGASLFVHPGAVVLLPPVRGDPRQLLFSACILDK